MPSQEELARYADLVVRFGANVGAGQDVFVNAFLEHAPFAREITRAAYAAGARYVDVSYGDQQVRKALIERAPEDALDWSPPWELKRVEEIRERHGAIVSIAGEPDPDALTRPGARRQGPDEGGRGGLPRRGHGPTSELDDRRLSD